MPIMTERTHRGVGEGVEGLEGRPAYLSTVKKSLSEH